MQFKQVIQTEDQLRSVIGHPNRLVTDKAISEIDDLCAAFIAQSPFMLISSTDANGNPDISPKGDPPGFVQVANHTTLLIPDRPGNQRADTLSNILQNPKVGLFFLVPGKRETLRVSGTAQIIQDDDLRDQFAVNGKPPVLLIAVAVEEAFFHCAKCVVRSHLWEENDALQGMPSLAEAMVKHGNLELTIEEMQVLIDNDQQEHLY